VGAAQRGGVAYACRHRIAAGTICAHFEIADMTHHSPRHDTIAPRDASSAARRNAGVPFVVGYALRKQLDVPH